MSLSVTGSWPICAGVGSYPATVWCRSLPSGVMAQTSHIENDGETNRGPATRSRRRILVPPR